MIDTKMEFQVEQGGRRIIEIYFDDQAGVEPGWCWRGKGLDAQYCGGQPIDASSAEEALQVAKSEWGVE